VAPFWALGKEAIVDGQHIVTAITSDCHGQAQTHLHLPGLTQIDESCSDTKIGGGRAVRLGALRPEST
jgi:hypothetical protein